MAGLPRLRFPDEEIERAFLDEYASLDRWRYLLVWGISIPVVVGLRFSLVGTPEETRVLGQILDRMSLPVVGALFAFGFAPPAIFKRGWQAVQTVGGAAFPGAVAIAAMVIVKKETLVSPIVVDFGAGVMGLTLIAVSTVTSLRLIHAALATVGPAAFYLAVLWAARGPDQHLAVAGFFTGSGLAIGLTACLQFERLRRAEFLRRRELAEERAKTEQSLKREISHQVAQRSKQLGEELARAGASEDRVTLRSGGSFDMRYRVIRSLGAGGMGAVYEVERLTDAQHFALKIILGHVSGARAARFAREAEIGARIHHANLVSIVDIGVASSGAPFLVMDLVRGGSLEDRRPRFGDMTWAKALLCQVADGIVALHAAGVVHRDLKPGNILLDGAEPEVAKISDFGISRLDGNAAVDAAAATVDASTPEVARLTGTGAFLGTPQYMAPELARGARDVDGATDVFAFGILAYEMLTARAPFRVPPLMLALARQPVPTPDPLEGRERLSRCVLACMAEDPARRPTMREVRGILEAS
jgi:hypothetical protein